MRRTKNYGSSDRLVEGSADDVILLLGCQLDEVYGIAGNADGQLGVIFGMFLSIQQGVTVQNVDIEVMAALGSIAVQKIYEIVDLCSIIVHVDILLVLKTVIIIVIIIITEIISNVQYFYSYIEKMYIRKHRTIYLGVDNVYMSDRKGGGFDAALGRGDPPVSGASAL